MQWIGLGRGMSFHVGELGHPDSRVKKYQDGVRMIHGRSSSAAMHSCDPCSGFAGTGVSRRQLADSHDGELAEAVVDLEAIAHNTRVLVAHARGAVMAVVKADGFGHGAVHVARTALAHGAGWLGVTSTVEALTLRTAGITAPVLAWMHLPDEDFTEALLAGVDLSAPSPAHLAGIAACAEESGIPAVVHLKVDTGLRRNGSSPADWPRLTEAASRLERAGLIRVRGLWSHLVHPDAPDHPTTALQIRAFETAVAQARDSGLSPDLLHLANSGATLAAPDTHYDLVRAGLALYGVEPVRGRCFGLRPAMTLRGRVIMNRKVDTGDGVSYGHDYVTEHPGTLVLVPLGYADGLSRVASGTAQMWVAGARRPVAGRIAMDQCVVDTGDMAVSMGEEVVAFGPGTRGEPTAAEWAEWGGTTAHEVLTGIAARIPRRYLPADEHVSPLRRLSETDARIRVVVLFGGPDGEYEVSCASAAGIVSHLDRTRYAVQPIRVTTDGEWVPGPAELPEGNYLPRDLLHVTPAGGTRAWDSVGLAMPALVAADVVLPALHGPFGEDGTVQALMNAVNVPYVGNGVTASAICMDKDTTKRILGASGVAVTPWALLRRSESSLSAEQQQELGLPVFVKPARAGSSIGVSRLTDWGQLEEALAVARAWDSKVLVEKAVPGREIDVAVLEHPDGRLEAGPPLEIEVNGGRTYFDYQAKYEDRATRFTIPAHLDPDVAAHLQRLALQVFETLDCSGLVRVDFFLRDGTEPVVNEVNTFPGFTTVSQYPQIWAAAGVPYERLLDLLIDTALARDAGTPLGCAGRAEPSTAPRQMDGDSKDRPRR